MLLGGVIGTIEMKASANIYIIEYAEAFIFSDISGAFFYDLLTKFAITSLLHLSKKIRENCHYEIC